MGDYIFERDCRTPHSESYVIIERGRSVGRVELHFTQPVVHGTLCIPEGLGEEDIRDIIRDVDRQLIDVLGIPRQDLVFHVFAGQEIGIFGDQGIDQNGNGRELL